MSRNASIAFLLIAACFATSSAEAGFCDWLFGRRTTPYAAGYAPVAGYAPSQTTYRLAPAAAPASNAPIPNYGYQAQRQTFDNPSVYTGQPVTMAPANPPTAYQLPANGTAGPLASVPPVAGAGYSSGYGNYAPNPAAAPPAFAPVQPIQVQPVTGVGGVGTGLPFRARNTGGEVPLASVLRGNTSSNPFYGTGNIYPNNFRAPTALRSVTQPYSAGYGAAQVATTPIPVTPNANLVPSTSPLFPNSTQPRVGGLARFFGSLLGTNYRSSYYRAPVTYYRPVNSVDPITGAPVIVQQPCSSCVQNLQRIPYNTFQHGGGTRVTPLGPLTPVGQAQLNTGCQNGSCSVPLATQYGPSQYGPSQYLQGPTNSPTYNDPRDLGTIPAPSIAPATGFQPSYDSGPIGQVGGVASPSDRRNIQSIPSTDPMPSYYRQNTAPLTGSPSADDRQDVGQPRLESARPRIDDTFSDGLYRDDVSPYAIEDKSLTAPRARFDETSDWRPRGETSPSLNSPSIDYSQGDSEPEIKGPQIKTETRFPASSDTTPLSATPLPKSPFPGTRDVEIERTTQAPKAPTQVYSDVMPIQAPEGYKSPYAARKSFADPSSPRQRRLEAPELPSTPRATPRMWTRDSGSNNASSRVTVPVREATTQQPSSLRHRQPSHTAAPKRKPVVRDSTGWLPL